MERFGGVEIRYGLSNFVVKKMLKVGEKRWIMINKDLSMIVVDIL